MQEKGYTQTPPENEFGDSFDLREFARLLLKRKWVILATLALVMTATLAYTLRLPKIYRASASIVIDPKPPEILGGQVQEVVQLGAGQQWWNEEYYNTQVTILESRSLARLTVEKHNLHFNPELIGEPVTGGTDSRTDEEKIDAATDTLLGILSVKPPAEQNRIFHIRAEHTDPELAAYLANAHVDTYIQYNINLRAEGTNLASKWLTGELDNAEKDLRNSEAELLDFKRKHNIYRATLEDKQKEIAANIARYTDAVNEARISRIQLESLNARLKEAKGAPVLESTVFDLTGSETGRELKRQYYQERQKLMQMAAELGPKNPDYLTQQKKVDEIFAALEREARISIDAVQDQYRAALATEAQHEQELEKYRKLAAELNPKATAYKRLARKEKSNEEKFNLVLGRLGSSDLTGRLKTVNIRLLDEALQPSSPAYPRVERNLALAGVLALVLGIALAFLLEYLDRTVKTAEDVEAAVHAPLLGIIPLIADMEKESNLVRDLHVFHEPTSRTAECCRSIRTNLLFMSADHEFRTLLVASPNPREGKSTTVIYLATTMAQSGQRVLVVDSDLRRPRLHQSLGTSRATGLSNLILGDVTAEDAVKTTEIPNLFFLPSGPTPPNPAELLMTDRFRETMNELKSKYDRIIFDSPPVLAVTDALVLSKHTEGTVLVVRAGTTAREDAKRAAQQLFGVEARIAGAILNELDIENRSYGYYYHYYAYGYGEEQEAAGRA